MDNLYIIKDRLNEAMKLRGFNITELAEMSGLNKSTVSRYLSGTCIPRTPQIGKMAEVLGVSPAWVLGYDVNMKGEILSKLELQKLTEENKVKLFAYYQGLIDSQGERK